MKARGVKQGFKENKELADGPGCNYYSHVAKLVTVRMAVLRPDRRDRRLSAVDIRQAFLQAHQYPEGMVKYIVFICPLTGQKRYFRQSGPIYGEASAPVRWEHTLAPWMVEMGFTQAMNEQCVFYHEARDLLVISYVDDCLSCGFQSDIEWFEELLATRFDCKEMEWLSPDTPLDFPGMNIIMDKDRIYISMEKYIHFMLDALDMSDIRPASLPIKGPIDGSSAALLPHLRRKFMTGNGMLGWLVNTARPDVAYAHSRQSQHMANPTQSAYESMEHTCRYLKGNAHFTISVPLRGEDAPVSSMLTALQKYNLNINTAPEFYVDSDLADNTEVQNKRRSQNGAIGMRAGAPFVWSSKVTSVAFAHPLIGEAHADVSSASVEIYAAGNGANEFVHTSYISGEMGMAFPLPLIMGIENTACIAFVNNSCAKTNLKHIDCRQEWVKLLRDKSILVPHYVNTIENIADLFTKVLGLKTFNYLRAKIMIPLMKST
jgi:hypothetical protein